jgi:putative ABC transport system permease protein
MTFVVRMALREIRASWRRLVFFFVCIAVGVASIVAIRSLIQSVRVALTREAQALTGGDLVIAGNSAFSPRVRETVAREHGRGRIQTVSESVEIATMVRAADRPAAATRMVELRAVEPPFPLYGTLALAGTAYSHELLRGHGALVRPELLAQLGVAPGDRILIGTKAFEIRGVVDREPGRNLGAFSLGPRVFIDHADLPSTGLLTFGSRASYQLLMRTGGPDEELAALAEDLRTSLADEFVRTRTYRQNENRMTENLTRAENYLSLVGLVVLMLGGIGVSSVTRVFIQQKVKSIAILKCVGSTSRQVLALYLTQVLSLGLAGSLLGVAIAGGVIAALPAIVSSLVPLLPPEYGLTMGAVGQGVAVGMLVATLFSAVPLLDVRHVKPSFLLRQTAPPERRLDWLKWVVASIVVATLVGVASWQGGSLRVGLLLSGGLLAVITVLHLTGAALIRAAQALGRSRSFVLRQAAVRVGRPGNQTRVVLLAVGLGAFFILGVRGLQANLLRDFSLQAGPDAPDMFLIDVQPDQRERLTAFLDQANGAAPPPRLIPAVRARVVGVSGREVNLDGYQAVRGRGLGREYTVTYRRALEANETVVDGRWWDEMRAGGGEAEVSIEEGVARPDDDGPARGGPPGPGGRTAPPGPRGAIHVGDLMRFDVLGQLVEARVTSIRKVDWEDFRAGGFMFVFRPGALDQAPQTFITALRGPADPGARARMQAALVAEFPNVSLIDLREILQTVRAIVDNVTLAVTVVGGMVLLSGALILVGSIAMTKYRRVYEAAILKTLGASSRLIAAMLFVEYGLLGALAGCVGALGAVALSWSVARYVLELRWAPSPLLTLAGILGSAGFVAAIGVLASLDVLRHKPLATLRAE